MESMRPDPKKKDDWDMWRKCTHTLATHTKLCFTKVQFKWTDREHNYLVEMNKIVDIYFLLSYTNFREEFIVNPDSSIKISGYQ